MARIELDIDGLFTPSMLYTCPSHRSALGAVKERFKDFTLKNEGIYSGYRQKVLERDGLGESKLLAQKLRDNFDTMFVLGIGGSALGARTALSALNWGVAQQQRRRV